MITYTIYSGEASQCLTVFHSIKGMQTHHKKRPFQPITFTISQKVTYHQDPKHDKHDHEDLEVQIHGLVQNPTYDYNKWTVEKRGLDGRAQAVIKRNIDNAIVGFINCCKVFSGLLDERQENQAEELIGNATMHNGLDLFDEIDEKQGCEDERQDQCNSPVDRYLAQA